MKKILVKMSVTLLALVITISSCTTPQTSISQTGTNKQALSVPKTLLWKIEGNGIQPSHIYGTIHMISQSDFFLAETTKQAFNNADQIVLEIDMDNPNLQVEMMQNAVMSDGTTLDKLLSKEDYEKVNTLLQSTLGAGIEPFKTWQPMLTSSLFLAQLIDGPPASYEGSFVKMAMEKQKEILGLETIKEQVAAMDKIDYKEQAKMLMQSVDDLEMAKSIFAQMVSIYKTQDIEELIKFMVSQPGGNLIEKELINQRNHNWIPRIGELAKNKSTFFGVGSGHLGGKQGVIQLLKKAGYTVTPVLETQGS